MSKIRTSLYVEEEVDRAVSEMASKSATTEGVPELSKSEVYRKLIDDGLKQNTHLLELLDEADRILLQREQHVEKEARLQSLRAGFESRCIKHCKRRFEDGIRLSEVDEWAMGLKQDAQILWPDDEQRRREAMDYVDSLTDHMKDAMRGTDYDPLDPETVFSSYGTVSEAIDEGEALSKRDLIRDEFERRRQRLGEQLKLESVAESIANQHGLESNAVYLVLEDIAANDAPALRGESDD